MAKDTIKLRADQIVPDDSLDLKGCKYLPDNPAAEFEYAVVHWTKRESEDCIVIETNQGTFACPAGYLLKVQTIPVIFRNWVGKGSEGEIIAVFPTLSEGHNLWRCYQHVGQHGTCNRWITWKTSPAYPEEYADLKRELESSPYYYRLRVIQKWPKRDRRNA